jgi:hypothetical protein
LTDFGHRILEARNVKVFSSIELGWGIGTWFPLDEMFPLKSGEEYTVVAAIRGVTASYSTIREGFIRGKHELVSAPLAFRMPELEIAGVNRPRYGSAILWNRLASLGSEAVSPDGSRRTIEPTDLAMGGLSFELRSRAGNHQSGRHVDMETTLLVRDAEGKPVAPMENERGLPKSRELYNTPVQMGSGNSRLREDAGPVFVSRDLNGYPVVVGQQYTVLAAFDFKDKKTRTIVAPPLTVTPQPSWRAAIATVEKRTGDGARSQGAAALHGGSLSVGHWESLAPFADKAFEGLILKAFDAKGGGLKVVLTNCADRPLIVKKWELGSGFGVLVRDQSGAEVRLSEAGRKYFQAGKSLQMALLKPRETIEQFIPITELFDMKTPGEYIVLASLPVIGDVDAVLTAAPVRIRVDQKPTEPKK